MLLTMKVSGDQWGDRTMLHYHRGYVIAEEFVAIGAPPAYVPYELAANGVTLMKQLQSGRTLDEAKANIDADVDGPPAEI